MEATITYSNLNSSVYTLQDIINSFEYHLNQEVVTIYKRRRKAMYVKKTRKKLKPVYKYRR